MVIPCSRSARRPSVSRARSVCSSPRPWLTALHGLELVLEDRLAVEQQSPDQGRLAVVDRAGGREPQELRHQKYPSFLRSSMPASLIRSSARVAPRSVRRVAATSVTTSSRWRGRGLDAPRTGDVADGAEADGRLERPARRCPAGRGGGRRGACRPGAAPIGGGRSRWLGRSTPSSRTYCQMSSSVQLLRGTPGRAPRAVPTVVEAPQLGALVAGIPLAELVPEAEDPLLGPGPLLVASRATEDGVESALGDRPQEGDGLQGVAETPGTGVASATGVDVVLDGGHHEADPERRRRAVAVARGPRRSCGRCRCGGPGNGGGAGQKAAAARCSITTESFPPEKRSTGRSNSAATSRKMWMASASSARRCVSS